MLIMNGKGIQLIYRVTSRTLFFAALFLGFFASELFAHQTPTLVVEAEFTNTRESTIRVNIDPRLILSDQPTTLPPVAAAWYLDQDADAKMKAAELAQAYLAKPLVFKVGDTVMKLEWKFVGIDSATNLPLNTNSAEVHLLAEAKGPLPAVQGDFVVELSKNSTISMILLNSREGVKERRPDVRFPGEVSRGYPLPGLLAK